MTPSTWDCGYRSKCEFHSRHVGEGRNECQMSLSDMKYNVFQGVTSDNSFFDQFVTLKFWEHRLTDYYGISDIDT
jgi:hypothetical protein